VSSAPQRRVASPTFVGRAGELALLRESYAAAPGAVFLRGEAGVGKSRLVAEFVAGVKGSATVLTGVCLPGTGLAPYAPIVQAIRGPAAGGVLEVPAGGPLVRLLTGGPDDDPVPRETDQGRLFQALLAWLEALAAAGPVVLVLEDLHWADASTRDVLDYLLRSLRHEPVFVLGTYRDDEVPGHHPLRSVLAELSRLPGPARGTTVELRRFDAGEAREQIEGILGGSADDALVGTVFARSEGNPFLVEELVAVAGDDLPATLRDILLARCRDLPPEATALLQAVAVAGRAVPHPVLAAVAPLPEEVLLGVLRAVVERHILVPAGTGYGFRHALVAEAVLAETLPGERLRLHRRLADALERLPGAGGGDREHHQDAQYWSELAHHRFAARDLERALVAAIRAGLAAERVFALAEARRHFERAIDLWYDAPGAHAHAALDLVDLHRHAAETAYLLGDTDQAITVIRAAIAAATTDAQAALLHERHGRYLWCVASPADRVVAAHERAVALVPPEPTRQRARALAGLATVLTLNWRFTESQPITLEGLAVAREAGARDEEAHILTTHGMNLAALGQADLGLATMRHALELAGDGAGSETLHRSYCNLSDALREHGLLAESADVALAGLANAEGRGIDSAYGDQMVANAVEALVLEGRWAEALAWLPDGPRERGLKIASLNRWVMTARLLTGLGRLDEADEYVTAAERSLAGGGHSDLRFMLAVQRADLEIWRRRPAAAVAALDRLDDLVDDPAIHPYAVNALALGLRAAADLRDRTGEPGPVRRYARWLDTVSGKDIPESRAYRALAVAELHRADGASETAAWARASEAWERFGAPYHRAYALFREGEALLHERGTRRDAAERLTTAASIATELGAAPLLTEVAALAARARLTLEAGARPERAPVPFGLTPREIEVLGLVAGGDTNREIARRLFISERTVGIHVSHILAKLGVANRSAAAAMAHRNGLLPKA
jgi:DNA-binding CsgD family transcriptional regulator/tetratricopeptide (TPR) repeat protein